MARLSLNRVCSRALQDKFYQLLINRNQSTIYQHIRNSSSTVSGTFNQSKTNGFQDVGPAPFAKNTQVNSSTPPIFEKQDKQIPKTIFSKMNFVIMHWNYNVAIDC